MIQNAITDTASVRVQLCRKYGKLRRVTRRARLTLNWKGRMSTSFFSCCWCCREAEDGSDEGTFLRSEAVVSVRLRLAGTGPTSVTVDADAGVVAPMEEEGVKFGPTGVSGDSAKGLLTLP